MASQVSSTSVNILSHPQKLKDALQRSFIEVKQDNLWASKDVIKRRPRDLKLGLHSDFGPISSFEFGL